MLQGFAAVNKRLSSGGVLTGWAHIVPTFAPRRATQCAFSLAKGILSWLSSENSGFGDGRYRDVHRHGNSRRNGRRHGDGRRHGE